MLLGNHSLCRGISLLHITIQCIRHTKRLLYHLTHRDIYLSEMLNIHVGSMQFGDGAFNHVNIRMPLPIALYAHNCTAD